MGLLPKDTRRLFLAASDGGMYPGVQWDLNPKAFKRLQALGYVRLFVPHNHVHKDRAVITEEGRVALAAANNAEGRSNG
jgi:hypothetical protein